MDSILYEEVKRDFELFQTLYGGGLSNGSGE
jgi:hypothetical protein